MSARTSRTLIVLAILVVLAIYVRDYLRAGCPRSGGKRYVIQCGIAQLGSDILLERQPVVIDDRIFDISPLAKDVLRYQHVYLRNRKRRCLSSLERPIDTLARATFFSPKCWKAGCTGKNKHASDKFVLAARPVGSRPEEEIAFRLRTSQVLVLPAHWQVRCVSPAELSADDQDQDEVEIEVDMVEAFDLLHLAMWGPMRALFPYRR